VASTIMHERGHNIGLYHGGAQPWVYKPNYLSVMNYSYQFANLDPDRPLDYSREPLNRLDENGHGEAAGVICPSAVCTPAGRKIFYYGPARTITVNSPE
jgi:hypothetical protein